MLLDLDAFFASVEQLDHPEWRGKPVIVGGDAERRGVVATCSYEARAFGVRSAMPASQAATLCPDAIWTHAHFSRYKELSGQVMSIMRDESPFIQQVSIDEAFLDITPSAYHYEDPVAVARRIQARVSELGISCSVGLGSSKAVAKTASDMDKPRGLTVVFPGRERNFLANLDIKRMSGIGPVAQKTLHEFGIFTMGDVVDADTKVLEKVFGKNAQMMRLRCMGADSDPVADNEPTKSISNEISFAVNLENRQDIEAAIATVCAKVARRLRKASLKARTATLKIRYGNRKTVSISASLPKPSDDEYLFTSELCAILDKVWTPDTSVRLIGMAATHFDEEDTYAQEQLFDLLEENPFEEEPAQMTLSEEQRDGLKSATDRVRDRFGETAVMFGREIRTNKNLTGSASKNPADYKKPKKPSV